MQIYSKLKKNIQQAPKTFWVLLAIIVVGIFLRTYNFHAWLDFENDQARDAFLVGDVLNKKANWPLLGPTMRGLQNEQGNLFHLGPIYYYFQIISGKIFGNYPDKFAYTDWLFSILAIPFLYIFIKKYFTLSVSLALTGLFSFSFFAIKYARFAWNPNSIPFFALLFLLSLYEFIINKEKTRWLWIVAAGGAIGVGVQLHVILLILFPVVAFFVFVYLLKENWRIWKKLVIILAVVFILNSSQIASEIKNNFLNSRIFINYVLSKNSAESKKSLAVKLGMNLNCQIEANAHIISSFGSKECIFSYRTALRKILHDKKNKKSWKEISEPNVALNLILGCLFSLIGYGFLAYRIWKEKNEQKRIFLRLISLYIILSFLIMLPLAEKFTEFRYFIHVFFVPFLFIGFFANFLKRKLTSEYFIVSIGVIITILLLLNLNSIKNAVKDLRIGEKSDTHFAILGEIELMLDYIINASGEQEDIYLVGDKSHVSHFFQAFLYLAEKKGRNIISDESVVSLGRPIFYLTDKVRKGAIEIGGYEIESYKIFGKVVIYKLKGL